MPSRLSLVVRPLVVCLLFASAVPKSARAVELLDGRVQIHGYVESQLRTISDAYHLDRFYPSMWANILDVELEADLAPNGFGPFDLLQAYTRLEVRYDCVWSKMCGLVRSYDYFGDRATRVPRNFADGRRSGVTGVLPNPDEPKSLIHGKGWYLLDFTHVPPLDQIGELGGDGVDRTFAPVRDARFAVRAFGDNGVLPQGPWRPNFEIQPIGSLALVPNVTIPDLPLRPLLGAIPNPGQAQGLYIPSRNLRNEMDRFGTFDQNFTQNELRWNHGASQDEHELKEAYLDIEMFEGRLWMRLGKQNIVWGKTELFRTTDQFNPVDIGLVSLGSLEETRIALWAARAVWSFYSVGPLDDVRLEFAANLDQMEPIDLGKCGEPYAVFLVCGKTAGLYAHGILGAGLAGEIRPPDPWDDIKGLEFGGRLEFRWDRFSFAITDFYGYSDSPTAKNINVYERKVDPFTGRPLDVNGVDLSSGDASARQRSITDSSINRQFFDVFCSATTGVASQALGGNSGIVLAGIDNECALSLTNSAVSLAPLGVGNDIRGVLSALLAGGPIPQAIFNGVLLPNLGVNLPAPVALAALVNDAADGAFGQGISSVLTDQQEALLGCGPFYGEPGNGCNSLGIDLMNAEASVLLQAFPQFEPGGPVGTRFVNGQLVILPGARGPGDAGYNPLIDGTPPPALPPDLYLPNGKVFKNEMEGVSYNFLQVLAALGAGSDANCSPAVPLQCALVRAIFGAAGTQRPELKAGGNGRFGRRDFFWHSGSEIALIYNKRNVFGISADFAEDVTKTNWGVEFTWVNGENYQNAMRTQGYGQNTTFNLTVSVDRPTFINFLNANRTFLFNSQWFVRYIDDYQRGGVYAVSGPLSVLGTFTIFTGYYQDRLLPALTFVHDFRSNSGAVLGQVTYRFSEVFSASFGLATFYGNPQKQMVPLVQPLIGNNTGSFTNRTKFDGLSALAERDEAFLQLRYTF